MLTASIVLFALAAAVGLYLVRDFFAGKRPTIQRAYLHGGLAVIGLILLIIAMLQGAVAGATITALILFIVAALGGLVLFFHHVRGRILPKGLLLIHPIVAVVGFLTLLVFVVS